MKTSTVIVLALVLLVYMHSSSPAPSSGVTGVAPPPRVEVPQSGGGDTVNQVLALMTAGATVAAKAIDLATDRGSPKT